MTASVEPELSSQIITCLGNKRSLLGFIEHGLQRVLPELPSGRLTLADFFSGSGIVARLLKKYAARLVVNDLETYATVLNRCYLANPSDLDLELLRKHHKQLVARLNMGPLEPGLIANNYAPKDDGDIAPGERVFYTRRNACYIDTARRLVEDLPETLKPFFLAPLLVEASIHTNTSGVFKGFYKNRATGVGRFGGTNSNALSRIQAPVSLPFPVWGAREAEVKIFQKDANALARSVGPLDLVYLDPPYNQHPYGSNYFMLNVIADYKISAPVSPVSGIPSDWNRSRYNSKSEALDVLMDVVETVDAPFILLSFNNEGFLPRERLEKELSLLGKLEIMEKDYPAFRGSRNLKGRNLRVNEYLYILKKERR